MTYTFTRESYFDTVAPVPAAGGDGVTPGCGESLYVELIRPGAVTHRLRYDWRGLSNAADTPNPYFEPWFLEPALAHLDTEREVHLCTVRASDGALIALTPIVFQSGYAKLPLKHAAIWIHRHCYNGTPLIRRGYAAAVYGALLDWIDTRPAGSRFLRLQHLPFDAQTRETVSAACESRNREYRIQAIHERAVLSDRQNFDAVMHGAMSGKKRKELRRISRRFAELGDVEFAALPVPASLDRFIAMESAGWKASNPDGFAIARSEADTAFFREAMTLGADEGAVTCAALTLDNRPVAMTYSLRSGDRLSAFKTSFDESLGTYSPGLRVLIEATRRMLAEPGIKLFDSCAKPDHPVVDRLWPERLTIAQINIPTRHAADRAALAIAAKLEQQKIRVQERIEARSEPDHALDEQKKNDQRMTTHEKRMETEMFKVTDRTEFEANYPDKRAVSQINVDSPLFKRPRLIGLANSLPADLVEFNAGDLPVSVSPDNIPDTGMSAAETIEKIGTANSWMTIRNIEKDAEYRDLAHGIIDAMGGVVREQTGDILRREAFIFISSPGAVTPFHIDEEHNILIQIEGTKTFTIYSQHDRELASQTDLERFHSGAHRNLTLNPEMAGRGEAIHMEPGTALYVPPLAPHHVKVTSAEPSLSLSITWRSNASKRTCYLHQINHKLRERGAQPKFPGKAPVADQLKIWKASAAARIQKLGGGARMG